MMQCLHFRGMSLLSKGILVNLFCVYTNGSDARDHKRQCQRSDLISTTNWPLQPGSPVMYRFRRGLNLQKEVHGTEMGMPASALLNDTGSACV